MSHIVMCRLCKKRFDTDLEETVVKGQKSYYHKRCYEEWVENKSVRGHMDNEYWYEAVIDYLYRDVKMSVDFMKIRSQWENFLKPGKKMTPKGIYFTIRYFYEIEKGDPAKAQGGIGIVQSLYPKATQYWHDMEVRKSGTIDAIIEQINNRKNREVKVIKQKTETKQKSRWNLDNL